MDTDDDFGCLGIPTPLEMWKHHTILLGAEIEENQQDLRRMRNNVARLVEINTTVTVERDQLRIELARVTAMLSEMNRQDSERVTSDMGYAYPTNIPFDLPPVPISRNRPAKAKKPN